MGRFIIPILLVANFIISGISSWVVYGEANRSLGVTTSVILTLLTFVVLFLGAIVFAGNKIAIQEDEEIDKN